jgi:hypothetical protein
VTKHAVISVPTNVLEAVAKWTGTDGGRPHLHQVLFTKGTMVAVDGHRMVIAPCETFGLTIGVDRDHLLAAVAAQRAMKADRSHLITIERRPTDPSGIVRLGIGPRGVHLVVTAADASSFPPYQQVVSACEKVGPSNDSPQGYGFDPRYLADIAEVDGATCAASGGLRNDHGVKITAWAPERLDAMVFENQVGVKFLIMPMRI